MCSRARACDAVGLLGVDHHLEGFAGALQGVRHLQRVLEEHVVVLQVVDDQQLRL